MSMSDDADAKSYPDSEVPPETAEAETEADSDTEALVSDAPRESEVVRIEQPVELERTVRYGRILIVATVIGAVVAALITLMFPIPPDENYTMGQIVGFMLVAGAAVGLALGAILALVLGRVAKRHRGSGVAIQTDVR